MRLCYFDEDSAASDGAASSAVDDRYRRDPFGDSDSNSDSDSDDDDRSEASGDTVPHNDCPPPPANATREEINRLYWEWCYGPVVVADSDHAVAGGADDRGGGCGGSTMRSVPAKSW